MPNPYKAYQTLNGTGESALLINYPSPDSLKGKFITTRIGKEYRVWNSLNTFQTYLDASDETERNWHEVILDVPQKLKWDIDGKMSDVRKLADNYIDDTPIEKHILSEILDAIIVGFLEQWNILVEPSDFVICSTPDPQEEKMSYHIILAGYYVSGVLQTKLFSNKITEYMPTEICKFVDFAVDRTGNLRLAQCHKTGQPDRVKHIISAHSWADAAVTYTRGCKLLTDIVSQKDNAATKYTSQCGHHLTPNAKRAIRMAQEIRSDQFDIGHFAFRNVTNNGIISFDRRSASYCDLCDDTHHVDNTLLMFCNTNTEGKVDVFRDCRHAMKSREVGTLIGEASKRKFMFSMHDSQKAPAENWTDSQISKYLKKWSGRESEVLSQWDELPADSKIIVDGPILESFPAPLGDFSTLCVKAPMKMGKTRNLEQFINKYFPAQEIGGPRICVISFRKTFSGMLTEKFPTFTLYSDVKGTLTQREIIVQVESLHRLILQNVTTVFDLVVLDESESIIEQFDSGLQHGQMQDCFRAFHWLMRNSRHVIAMDANLGDRTYNIVQKFRGDVGLRFYKSVFKNATADSVFFTSDKARWMVTLDWYVSRGKRVVIPASSVNSASGLYLTLQTRYPNKHIAFYNAETSNQIKAEHFAAVHTFWKDLDILIYTPTVTAGVSFEEKDCFDAVFGWFFDASCTVETCMQMMGRVRNITDKVYYICMTVQGFMYPTTRDNILKALEDQRKHLFREYPDSWVQGELDAQCRLIVHKSPYYYLWLENTLVKNISHSHFVKHFLRLMRETGANIQHYDAEAFALVTQYDLRKEEDRFAVDTIAAIYDDGAKRAKHLHCEAIASRPTITDAENAQIIDMMAHQSIELTTEHIHSHKKHRLQQQYEFRGEITAEFVKSYSDPKVFYQFKNLCDMLGHVTELAAIEDIHRRELATYCADYNRHADEQFADLSRNYKYPMHNCLHKMRKILGWDDLQDTKKMHSTKVIHDAILANKEDWDKLVNDIRTLSQSSQTKFVAPVFSADTVKTIREVMKFANKYHAWMYGIKFMSKSGLYRMRPNELFTNDPANLLIPYVRCGPLAPDDLE